MAFVIKALGAGTLVVSGTSDLYTVPTTGSAIVSSVRLVNGTTAVSTAMNLYAKPSGLSARHIHKRDFTLAAGTSLVLEDVVTLGPGDKIQLDIAPGGTYSLGYLINGVQRD